MVTASLLDIRMLLQLINSSSSQPPIKKEPQFITVTPMKNAFRLSTYKFPQITIVRLSTRAFLSCNSWIFISINFLLFDVLSVYLNRQKIRTIFPIV